MVSEVLSTNTSPTITEQYIPLQTPLNSTIPEDRSSAEGKFGWHPFGNTHIPYLYRATVKYVAVQMIQTKIFSVFKNHFTKEVFNCVAGLVEPHQMTSVEARLLHEINVTHSDNLFGDMAFSSNGFLISLQDATRMYTFLQFCYHKLVIKSGVSFKWCGFVQINSQNCIPYVWFNDKQCVPLFYLDGEYKYLEERTVEVRGWHLAYFKCLCKIHGIGKSLFDGDSITVVDLELVKKFFPPGTPFEESWPTVTKTESLLKQTPGEVGPANNSNLGNLGIQPGVAQNPKGPRIKFVLPRSHPAHNMAPTPRTIMNTLQPINFHSTGCKIFQIPDFVGPKVGTPYFYAKTRVGSKHFNYCINLLPSDPAIMLVTLEEAINFMVIPEDLFVKALDYLKFDVFLPNVEQKKVLAGCNISSTRGLIRVPDFVNRVSDIRTVCFKMSVKK